jgi:hypothetical protein
MINPVARHDGNRFIYVELDDRLDRSRGTRWTSRAPTWRGYSKR